VSPGASRAGRHSELNEAPAMSLARVLKDADAAVAALAGR
jgi:hypothetical protein